jgi:TolB protein
MDGDGSGQRALPLAAEGREPSYAAGQIVFSGRRSGQDYTSLHLIAPDGRAERTIPGQAEDNWSPSFAPDGQKLAFVSSREGDWDIYTMNVDGSNVQVLAAHPAQDWAPAWSPDGRFIAFTSRRSEAAGGTELEQPDIWLVEADGSNLARLTNDPAIDAQPGWSSDSRRIVFTSNRDGNLEIYEMDLSGRNLRNLTNSPFDENYAKWSADGNWLAFSRFTLNNEIFVMSRDGEQLVNLTDHNDADWWPVWVPE